MSVEERLRAEDWGRIRVELAAYVWRRMGWAPERKDDAQDIAQETIARAFQRKDGWDPDKQPLRRFLANQAAGMAINHLRLFRNRFELPLLDGDAAEHDDDGGVVEAAGPADREAPGEAPDEVIDRRRHGLRFRARLEARVAEDEIAMAVVRLMLEGIDGAAEQAAESTYTLAELRFARRRVFHHAHRIAKELASDRADAGVSEVSR